METMNSFKTKLLFMDDNEGIRGVIEKMLTHRGYEVSLAANGTEAVELYQDAKEIGQPYDIVIVDLVVFWGLGGETTMKSLKEIDPDVKVILLSGFINSDMVTHFKARCFDDVIAKPVTINELDQKIKKVLMEVHA